MKKNKNYSKPSIPKVLHFILNTNCNAKELKPMNDSYGICDFCYSSKDVVKTTESKIESLLKMVRSESDINRIVFTGGESLMKNNHIEFAVKCAKELGFVVNIHTNGLLLFEKYQYIKKWVDIYTLAIDGSNEKNADFKRGIGYFYYFNRNIDLMINENRTLAFNTFVDFYNIYDLEKIAYMINFLSEKTTVEYWLISQYRLNYRTTQIHKDRYCFSTDKFNEKIEKIINLFPNLNIFSQPTRDGNLYPQRICLMADGNLTKDIADHYGNKTIIMGNCFSNNFIDLYQKSLKE